MIFVARIISLLGVAVTFGGAWVLFVMFNIQEILPPDVLGHWDAVFYATLFGGVMLVIGQMAGNDLFKLRGKDSLFRLKFDGDMDSVMISNASGTHNLGD